MSEPAPITVEIDEAAGTAYLSFSDRPVVRTEEFTEAVQVDLDEFDVAVGVEVLDLTAGVSIGELVGRYHIPSQVAELLLALERQALSGSGRTATSSGIMRPASFGTVHTTVHTGHGSWKVTAS